VAAAAGEYAGTLVLMKKFRQGEEGTPSASSRRKRVWDVSFAEAIKAKCLGKRASHRGKAKPKTSIRHDERGMI